MGFFDVLAAGFLAAAYVRQKVVGTEAFQRAMMIFFAAAICSGPNRIEIGDFAAAWRFRIEFANALDGLAGLPSGS